MLRLLFPSTLKSLLPFFFFFNYFSPCSRSLGDILLNSGKQQTMYNFHPVSILLVLTCSSLPLIPLSSKHYSPRSRTSNINISILPSYWQTNAITKQIKAFIHFLLNIVQHAEVKVATLKVNVNRHHISRFQTSSSGRIEQLRTNIG